MMATNPDQLSTAADVAQWGAHYAGPSGRRWWPAEELVRFAARRGDLGARVLEVGCGNGANLWFLADKAPLVVGVDLCHEALCEARAYADQRGCGREHHTSRPGYRVWNGSVALTRGRVDALPFPDETFDGLADLMVSQHVTWEAHAALYREYRRVLRPGGWLFLYHLTNRTSGGGSGICERRRLALFPDAGFTCLPSPAHLRHAVTDAGLQVRDARGMSREYPGGDRAHYAVIEAARDAA